MKIVITGATGFIGTPLVNRLVLAGHEVTALVRDVKRAKELPCALIAWDSKTTDPRILAGADAVIHLAGAPVAETRWSEQVKAEIKDSRVQSTRSLVDAIAKIDSKDRPRHFLSASAIGFYGDRGEEILTEKSPHGSGFLAEVVQAWEAEVARAGELGVRAAWMRCGVVLGRNGGALAKMQPVPLGSGKQWMSWIHREDLLSAIEFVLSHAELRGAFNAVSPEPVRNNGFSKALAHAKSWPLALPVHAPSSVLRLTLGEMSSVLLASQRVVPEALNLAGFRFAFDSLEAALADLFSPDEKFEAVQLVRKPIEEVFDFFSRAENLEILTPPWLKFRIVGKSTPQIQSGTLIDYRLKIHGVPVRWQSRIDEWNPQGGSDKSFVDLQTHGPYAKWHHTHSFRAVPGGTLTHDTVLYRAPVGGLGRFFAGGMIRRDVAEIFAFRRMKIKELVG